MSDNFDDLTVFARLNENGEVAEYPVYALHIRNRAQPFDWYVQVEYDTKPPVPEFFSLQETVSVSRTLAGKYRVKASYTVVPDSLATILNTLRLPGDMPGMFSNTPKAIADIPLTTVQRVAQLATQLAQDRMDAFAQARNYTNITSAASYVGSSIPNFDAEGKRAFQLRDATWAALYEYLGKVTSAAVPVPVEVAEIEAILPVLTWE